MLNWQKIGFYCLPPLLALAVVLGVTFKTDLSAFALAGDKAESILLASEMQTGALSRRYLISVGSDTQAAPKAFIRSLTHQFKLIEGVADVWLPEENKAISDVIANVYASHANGLYSLTPQATLNHLFSTDGLTQRALFLKNALLSPHGRMVKKIALQDPLLLSLNSFKMLNQQMKTGLKKDSYYQNLILETTMAGLNAPQQEQIQSNINYVFTQLNSTNRYQLEMTGVAVFAVATQNLIQGDIVIISILSSIALVVLFLSIFRSFSSLFQVLSVLIIVILSAMLTTHFIFGYVHLMTIGIGSTLVGICIDYPIHAIAHAQTVSPAQRTAVIAKVWPSMVLGGITTMIGYIALGISGYPGFQQVAVYAASGIMVSLLLTRFVFPHLITHNQPKPFTVPLVKSWTLLCHRFRPLFLSLLLLCFAASAFSIKSLHWMEDMQELTPELAYLKIKDKRIRERMTSIEPGRFILIVAADMETVLQQAEHVYQQLDRLKKTPDLTDYFGIYPWLLSEKQQRLNQSLLNQQLSDENLLHWQQALKQQGLSVKKLGHFNYTNANTLSYQQVLATPVKKLIDNRLINNKDESFTMLLLAKHTPEAVKKAISQIDGVQYISQRDMLNEMTKTQTQRAKTLLAIGLAFITLLLFSRYKNVLKTIQTLLPAVLAAFFILGFWSFTGASISFLHLVGFLLGVAICVDYGIFYQENRGGDLNLTYQAMAASMLTSIVAFGSLIVSESTSLRILASVVVLGVLLGFLLCPIIIKSNHTPSS